MDLSPHESGREREASFLPVNDYDCSHRLCLLRALSPWAALQLVHRRSKYKTLVLKDREVGGLHSTVRQCMCTEGAKPEQTDDLGKKKNATMGKEPHFFIVDVIQQRLATWGGEKAHSPLLPCRLRSFQHSMHSAAAPCMECELFFP